jgi:hypothetical protein
MPKQKLDTTMTVRLTSALRGAIEVQADASDMSRNEYAILLLKKGLEALAPGVEYESVPDVHETEEVAASSPQPIDLTALRQEIAASVESQIERVIAPLTRTQSIASDRLTSLQERFEFEIRQRHQANAHMADALMAQESKMQQWRERQDKITSGLEWEIAKLEASPVAPTSKTRIPVLVTATSDKPSATQCEMITPPDPKPDLSLDMLIGISKEPEPAATPTSDVTDNVISDNAPTTDATESESITPPEPNPVLPLEMKMPFSKEPEPAAPPTSDGVSLGTVPSDNTATTDATQKTPSSLSQAELARHLGVNASQISRHKNDPDFSARYKDTEGVFWRWNNKRKRFFPINEG